MKQLLGSAMIMMMIISTSYAQKKRVYLDERARITTKENAVSYEEWEAKAKGTRIIGPFREYYISGKLKKQQQYKANILNGEEVSFYENGQLSSKGQYVDGRQSGWWQEWYENGQLKEKKFYKAVEIDGILHFKRDGRVEEWYEDGQRKSKKIYTEGEAEGKWEKWHKNGQLKELRTYKAGEAIGVLEEWYKTGKLKMKGTYKEGVRTGVWETWYKNGQTATKGNYSKSEKVGDWERWYANGQLAERLSYEEGKRVGMATQWHLDGTKAAEYDFDEKVFVNGWDKDGRQLVKVGNGKMKHYDIEGEFLVEGSYKDGLKDGEWTYDNGYSINYSEEKIKGTEELLGWYSDDIYYIVESPSSPKGNMESFYRYIRANLVYPRAAKMYGHEGKVFLSFIVDKDGNITHTEIIRSVSFAIDREAVRILRESPAWNPGRQRGRAVKQKMTFPINFKLR